MPRSMVRAMAGEAEAKVQSQAKMAMSRGEAIANNKLVEAGDNLDVVSLHLRYLQTMMRISQPHVSISNKRVLFLDIPIFLVMVFQQRPIHGHQSHFLLVLAKGPKGPKDRKVHQCK